MKTGVQKHFNITLVPRAVNFHWESRFKFNDKLKLNPLHSYHAFFNPLRNGNIFFDSFIFIAFETDKMD